MNIDSLYSNVEARCSEPSFLIDIFNRLDQLSNIRSTTMSRYINCSYTNSHDKYIFAKQLNHILEKNGDCDISLFSYLNHTRINHIHKFFNDVDISNAMDKLLKSWYTIKRPNYTSVSYIHYNGSELKSLIEKYIKRHRVMRYHNPCKKCQRCQTRKKAWPSEESIVNMS